MPTSVFLFAKEDGGGAGEGGHSFTGKRQSLSTAASVGRLLLLIPTKANAVVVHALRGEFQADLKRTLHHAHHRTCRVIAR